MCDADSVISFSGGLIAAYSEPIVTHLIVHISAVSYGSAHSLSFESLNTRYISHLIAPYSCTASLRCIRRLAKNIIMASRIPEELEPQGHLIDKYAGLLGLSKGDFES